MPCSQCKCQMCQDLWDNCLYMYLLFIRYMYKYNCIVKHQLFFQRPPHSIELFTPDEIRKITEYTVNTYFRHFKMYKYAFTPLVSLKFCQFHDLARVIHVSVFVFLLYKYFIMHLLSFSSHLMFYHSYFFIFNLNTNFLWHIWLAHYRFDLTCPWLTLECLRLLHHQKVHVQV